MSNIIIRKLEIEDNLQLKTLILETEDSLKDERFWLPITAKSREHFLDEEWTYFLGAFKNEKLIGAVGLFFNDNEYGDSQKILGLKNEKIAELGRAMVAPHYRNNGIMTKLAKALKVYAKKIGINYIIATTHPDNKPSQKFLEKTGFKKKAFVTKLEKYDRDILLLMVVSNEE